jgi:hypothetical protein
MATVRQIAANKLNAAKSTGPKTPAGKRRVRANARWHGLSAWPPREDSPETVELARRLAGNAVDVITMQLAWDAAQAQSILTTIKILRIAWIQRAYHFGYTERPGLRPGELMRMLAAPNWRDLFDPGRTMPSSEPERLAEAIRRANPELAKLARYEARATARRNRALIALLARWP